MIIYNLDLSFDLVEISFGVRDSDIDKLYCRVFLKWQGKNREVSFSHPRSELETKLLVQIPV